MLWSVAAWFLGVYAIVQDLNVPLIVQPQIFGFLSLVSWAQVGTTLAAWAGVWVFLITDLPGFYPWVID